ncbi:MAG: tetratricopeptide repeat protein [Gammaproteobacteria bacterium]|nr:MAG: tetratricopeptide repeat protein [Gammaproteobacteria bacterium]
MIVRINKSHIVLSCLTAVLLACSTSSERAGPTIETLNERSFEIDRSAKLTIDREKAINTYREFLATQPDYPLRAEAMRRLADLEMESKDESFAEGVERLKEQVQQAGRVDDGGGNARDYAGTIRLYTGLLKAYPYYPGNDRVLYQLAKAYEHTGEQSRSLATLDRLVRDYPKTEFIDEAQFRRGELHFTLRQYDRSQYAYKAVVDYGPASRYFERALFMHGWSLFKQSRYDDALASFFTLVDRKLGTRRTDKVDEVMTGMDRSEREMLEDSFRAMTLSFSYLQGPRTVAESFAQRGQRAYEYYIYNRLGEYYIKRERIRDAAETYGAFARLYPAHKESAFMQLKVVEAYQKSNFATLALVAKEAFVTQYGVGSRYWRLYDEDMHNRLRPHLQKHLSELAGHFHASAQKSRKVADYQKAARWYRKQITDFPKATRTPKVNFLLAESLYEGQQYRDAITEYEKTAYYYPKNKNSAEAGYAALLAYSKYVVRLPAEQHKGWKVKAINSAVRFADTFPGDKRVASVLTKSAEELFAMHNPDRATILARRVLTLKPTARSSLRRTAWTVVAHTEFERGAFAKAESGYREVLRLTARKNKSYNTMLERLASSIYKQGEQQRAAGNQRAAVAHFLRIGKVVPSSAIRVTAEYDAAATLITLKDWKAAIRVLESFRRLYPRSTLQGEVTKKLAVAYLVNGQSSKAAAQYERIAATSQDKGVRRDAIWEAAKLYQKSGKKTLAFKTYKKYIKQFPRPVEQSMEARRLVAKYYGEHKDWKKRNYWLKQIITVDSRAGSQRSDRTRYLAAQATFTLAEPYYTAFRKVRLLRPLKKSLKKKKKRMQEAIKAYSHAADYNVASVTTAATYRIAEIYFTLSKDLLKSERPKKLNAEEREQYDVLLEEQAYPFEEKAIELHENNARRVSKGIYDDWVKRSFFSLSKLRPVRYAKNEKREVIVSDLR